MKVSRMAIAACALATHALLAPAAFAACPAGCSCWTEDGVSKMACGARPPAETAPGSATPPANGASAPRGADTAGDDDNDERWLTDEERLARLQERQRELDRKLLEIQRARFEARSRGDAAEEIERLEKAFDDVQDQRRATLRQIKTRQAD
jgi:hypothetical protein